jgi:hypothetical protein
MWWRRSGMTTTVDRPAEPTRGESILDSYVVGAPSAQNAVDVFGGEWSSMLPLSDVVSGPVPLFADDRVEWAIEQLGGVSGRSVLELGPLEGGHTYMLLNAGASVTAIEAQTRAYLKCLIAKELLGMAGAQFLLGDFMAYLQADPPHVDVCFASGVLYHMRSPVETLALIGETADQLFLWTHIYDEKVIRSSELLSPRFTTEESQEYQGFRHTLHRFEYASSLNSKAFCGGSALYSNWLSREDLFGALERFGWVIKTIGYDEPNHQHGPAIAVVASRR